MQRHPQQNNMIDRMEKLYERCQDLLWNLDARSSSTFTLPAEAQLEEIDTIHWRRQEIINLLNPIIGILERVEKGENVNEYFGKSGIDVDRLEGFIVDLEDNPSSAGHHNAFKKSHSSS